MATGVIPTSSLGGDGVSTTTFYREDGTWAVPAYPTGANPTGSVGLSAVNGVSTHFMRADASPAIDLGISPTWTAAHSFSAGVSTTTLAMTGALTGATSGAFSTTMTVGGGFGCNGKTAQTAYTVNAAISATAGATYTATEQGMLNDLKALVNQLRSALIANGITV